MKNIIYILIAFITIVANKAQDIRVFEDINHTHELFVKDSLFLSYYHGVVNRSTDYGNTWEKIHVGTIDDLYTIEECEGVIFAGGLYGTLIKSTDYGLTWEDASFEDQTGLHEIIFLDNKKGIIGGYGKIYTTSDAGKTWDETKFSASKSFSNLIVINNRYVVLHQLPTNMDEAFEYNFLFSDDFGNTWNKKELDLKGKLIYKMTYYQNRILCCQKNFDGSSCLAIYDADFEFVELINLPEKMKLNNIVVTEDDKLYISVHEERKDTESINRSLSMFVSQSSAVPSFHEKKAVTKKSASIFRMTEDKKWEFVAKYTKEPQARILYVKDNRIFYMQNIWPSSLGVMELKE